MSGLKTPHRLATKSGGRLLAVALALVLAGSAATTAAVASPPGKTAAPCSVLQPALAFFGAIQPGQRRSVIDVNPTLICRKVAGAGGSVSDYTLRLIGKSGKYRGKTLSTAVGTVWLTGNHKLHYTKPRVVQGYPERDWKL